MEKQRELILDLVEEHNRDRKEVESLAWERFGKEVKEPKKVEVSEPSMSCRKSTAGEVVARELIRV